MSSGDGGTSRLRLSDPAGSAANGNAALGMPSIEDKIAEKALLADYEKQIQQLERHNANLKKVLEEEQKHEARSKAGGEGKARHIAHAEGWQAVCTAPDYCKVGKDVVAFNSFATLDQKYTASSNVKARGTAVYRKGDVIKNVQADAGQHIVSGTSLGRGHVKILDGHENVKVNGIPVARHDSRCLINCDSSGAGGAPGKLVTEQKSIGGEGARPASEAIPGERTSPKLEALKKARDAVASGMTNLNAMDEYVNFQQTNEFLDELISQISGTEGSATGYAAQAARGLLGFAKDFVMGAGELAYEGVKAVPKLARLTRTQSGQLYAQLDAQILAENIKLDNVTSGSIANAVLNIGKAIVHPVTDPWAKGQYVESVIRGATEIGTLGLGWLKGSKGARAAKAVDSAKSIDAVEAAKSARPATGHRYSNVAEIAQRDVSDGVHVKANKTSHEISRSAVIAERSRITALSNEAADAERNASKARSVGDEASAAEFDSIAQAKIKEARKLLNPYVRLGDVQGLLDRLEVASPKDGAHFWSGWKDGALGRAGAMAEQAGGVSLETSPGGRILNGWDAINKSTNPAIRDGFWTSISEKYAAGAEGTIKIVQSDAAWLEGGGNVWKNTELVQILKQEKVSEAIFLDLSGNVRQVSSFEELKNLGIRYHPAPGR